MNSRIVAKAQEPVRTNPLLVAALFYASRGWPVLPLYCVRNGECTCGKGRECEHPGKHPRWDQAVFPHGVRSATTDPALIKKAWTKWPDANIGVATGVRSFDVLDVDKKGDGDGTLADLEARPGKLPDTVEQITGGGGRHIFFKPSGKIKNIVRFEDGLDTRSDGGYVVVPPSSHISGRCYEWEASSLPEDVPFAEMPAWLITEINRRYVQSQTIHQSAKLDPAAVLAGIPEGQRDETLFRYACRLRARNLDYSEAEAYW